METYVQSYLSRHFYIKTSDVGNDGIYKKDDTRKFPAPYHNIHLLNELEVVFSLSQEILREYTDIWAIKQKPDVNLEFYWSQLFSLLPLASRLAASTIGLDLVSVQPLEAPTGLLRYSDFIYSGDTTNINGRTYNTDRLRQQWSQFIDEDGPRPRQSWFGELNHPNRN